MYAPALYVNKWGKFPRSDYPGQCAIADADGNVLVRMPQTENGCATSRGLFLQIYMPIVSFVFLACALCVAAVLLVSSLRFLTCLSLNDIGVVGWVSAERDG